MVTFVTTTPTSGDEVKQILVLNTAVILKFKQTGKIHTHPRKPFNQMIKLHYLFSIKNSLQNILVLKKNI